MKPNKVLNGYINQGANALAQKINDDIVFYLDDDALRWHKHKMFEELKAIKPWPKSRRKLLGVLK